MAGPVSKADIRKICGEQSKFLYQHHRYQLALNCNKTFWLKIEVKYSYYVL